MGAGYSDETVLEMFPNGKGDRTAANAYVLQDVVGQFLQGPLGPACSQPDRNALQVVKHYYLHSWESQRMEGGMPSMHCDSHEWRKQCFTT